MDVVVRTPHGDADIDIVAAPASTTLADLLRAVTGQAAPAATRVDGRAVATTRPLADLDLVIGSLIDTRPGATEDTPAGSNEEAVGLVQLTGRGAGRPIRLHPGRFRIGSARRLHADELERSAVETPAFDIDISSRGVRITPGPDVGGALGVYAPTLGSELFDRELAWNTERLTVGGRLFELERPYREYEHGRRLTPNDDGSVPFQRSVGVSTPRRRVLVDAYEHAVTGGGDLWSRRRNDPGAFDVGFGIHADGSTIASVDLERHRGVALVGSDRFTAALARTLLIELATLHGPADLDITIASTPDHIAQWNWAKWLPHVRQTGPASPPELFDESSSLATWAASVRKPADSDADAGTVNLLVLDDISLWSQRDSPIRSLLVDPPPQLRIIALCVGLHEAPGMCTSLIEEVPPLDRLAHLTSVTASSGVGRPALFGSMATQHTRAADAPHVVTDIHPTLAEVTLAAEIARKLAPLDDLDASHRLLSQLRIPAPTLTELVDLATNEPVSATDVPVASLNVPIGVLLPVPGSDPAERAPVTVDLTAPLATIIVAGDSSRHDQTLATLLLGAAAQRRPDEMAILVISHERPAWHGDLPHISGWADRDDADDASRLVHRVAHVLKERPDMHVLVIIERAFAEANAMPIELVDAMTELAETLPNVHTVLTGDHPDSVPETNRARCGALAWVGDGGFGRLWVGDRQLSFQGVEPQSSAHATAGPMSLDAPELLIRPTTHGRAMTPLERRLTRSSVDTSTTDDDGLLTAAVARQVSALTAAGTSAGPSLLPPPLPITIGLTTLLERHEGDGVPIGLVDRPERAENEAYWWQPGSGGSILAAGSPRSGMTSLIDLVLCGVAARASADDLHLYAIEALPQRKRAFEALPHTGSLATPDEPEAVRQLVTSLHRIHTERAKKRGDTDVPDLVLLIGDVSRMVRSLPLETADQTMQQLADIAASGPSVGMNVIAIASRVEDLGPLARLTGDRLVGSTSDPADRAKLGAPAIGSADRHPGRCWSTAADRRVQLATPPASVDTEIKRLAPEPAEQRQPVDLTAGTTP